MDTTVLAGYVKNWHGIDDTSNERALQNAKILTWINMARKRIIREVGLRFGEFEAQITTVASQRAYTLPTGWIKYTSLYYIDEDDDKVDIDWFAFKKMFDARHPDPTATGSKVASACQWGNSVLLGPVPASGDETIYTSGLKHPTDLALDTTDDFLDAEWEGILWYTLVISGEYATVPEAKHAEWKANARQWAELNRNLYRAAKVPPQRYVAHDIGTSVPEYEET